MLLPLDFSTLISNDLNIYHLERGFFVTIFDKVEDRALISEFGQWFWGNARLSLQPWLPYFDPLSASILTASIWVRLPNFPLHMKSCFFDYIW